MSKNPFQDMTDMIKEMGDRSMQSFDKESLMKSHQQNIEALTEANRMAMDVMKSIATLQSQYIKQSFEDMSKIMREMMGQPFDKNADPKDLLTKQSSVVKEQVSRAFEHSTNVTSLLAKSQREMFDSMQKRYQENTANFIDITKKARTKH